ncbi:MAG: DUF6782 family putative metallopeptidase [Alphaproteobacteria bacterium]
MKKEVFAPSLKTSLNRPSVQQEEHNLISGAAKNYPRLRLKKDSLDSLVKLIGELEKSERGRNLLTAAEKSDAWIGFSHNMAAQGSYCEKQNRIMLNSSINSDKMVVTLAHELRHAEQFNTTVDISPSTDTSKTYLMGQFAIEADANAHSTLVAWELKQLGNEKPFEEFKKESPHIVNPFEEKINAGDTLGALDAAFNGWYTNMNIRRAYEKNYTGMLDQEGVRFSKSPDAMAREISPADTINRTCVYNNSNYFKSNPDILEDKEHLSLGHETWWSCWRTYRDLANRKDYTSSSEVANQKMTDIPRRENSDYYYEISPEQAKNAAKPSFSLLINKLMRQKGK